MKLNRFTKLKFLKSIGRPMLGRLWDRFSVELAARKLTLPPDASDDDSYYTALTALALAPEGLPDGLVEALFAIEAMATSDGQERLELVVMSAGLPVEFPQGATHGDIAVHVYLEQPALLTTAHNESRLSRLTAFEYYASKSGNAEKLKAEIGNRELLEGLTGDLDAWFKAHQRGHETTRIERYDLDGELLFVVRHGDTYARKAKVEARRLEIVHYRPAKEDVIVYAPVRDEIRIHAGTKGERELYRRAFGERWFGNAEHFCVHKAYTLEPLREDCAAVLDAREVTGVRQIVLREVELAWGRRKQEFMIRGGLDIHGSARSRGREAIPEYGTIVRAGFDFYLADQAKPRRVEVRTPNTVKIGRGCDPRVVHEWLSACGIRANVNEVSGAGCQGPSRTGEQGKAVAA